MVSGKWCRGPKGLRRVNCLESFFFCVWREVYHECSYRKFPLAMEAPDKIRATEEVLQTNRVQGLALFNEVFRERR